MRSRLLNILFIGITIGSESIYLHKGNDQSLVICSLLIISTLCIALAGYLDNDYHDQKIDRINGKEGVIASKNAIYLLYSSGTALGILYGWIKSQGVWIESLLDGLFFLLPTILLLLYASTLSRNKGIGNIILFHSFFVTGSRTNQNIDGELSIIPYHWSCVLHLVPLDNRQKHRS